MRALVSHFSKSSSQGISRTMSKIGCHPCSVIARFTTWAITVRDAIGDLPVAGFVNPKDSLHVCRKHSKITIDRLQHISHDGGSRDELPVHLRLQCHKKLDDTGEATYYCDVYGRMRWDTVAPTLTTGCTDVTKGRYAHPVFDRAITLREAALLQTFPIDYRFYGNSGQIARQIGNAVPVNHAKNLA